MAPRLRNREANRRAILVAGEEQRAAHRHQHEVGLGPAGLRTVWPNGGIDTSTSAGFAASSASVRRRAHRARIGLDREVRAGDQAAQDLRPSAVSRSSVTARCCASAPTRRASGRDGDVAGNGPMRRAGARRAARRESRRRQSPRSVRTGGPSSREVQDAVGRQHQQRTPAASRRAQAVPAERVSTARRNSSTESRSAFFSNVLRMNPGSQKPRSIACVHVAVVVPPLSSK